MNPWRRFRHQKFPSYFDITCWLLYQGNQSSLCSMYFKSVTSVKISFQYIWSFFTNFEVLIPIAVQNDETILMSSYFVFAAIVFAAGVLDAGILAAGILAMVAYRRSQNLKDLLVKAKVSNKRRSNRKSNGYFRCGRGFFKMCVTCRLIPENGIKTHKCNKTGKSYKITSPVSCISENVIYKISCKKTKCKVFSYIGQTKRIFCDRFNNHNSYVTEKKMEQICGAHFNEKGHTTDDMLPTIIEQVYPKGDDFLRLKREKMWITRYEDCANKHSWKKWPFPTASWRTVTPFSSLHQF